MQEKLKERKKKYIYIYIQLQKWSPMLSKDALKNTT